MTFNIGYAGGPTSLSPHRLTQTEAEQNLTAIQALIQTENPDILGIQEIDLHAKRSGFIDQVRAIAKNFPFSVFAKTWEHAWVPYPFSINPAEHFGPVLAGQALFSKFPILSNAVLAFPKPRSHSKLYNFFYLDRVAQLVQIALPSGKKLKVCNLHLEAWDKQARYTQAQQVLAQNPDIILGDFNALHPKAHPKNNFPDDPSYSYDQDPTLDLLLAQPQFKECLDTWPLEQAYTFPTQAPNRRLDYIFYKWQKLQLAQAYISPGCLGADHLPLVAMFTV